jgi:hypothetical protein
MRQAQRASVLPYLYISLSANDQQGGVHFNLTNFGIPAGNTILMVEFGPPGSQKLLPDVLRLFEIAEVPRSWYSERWRVRSDRIVPDRL